MAGKVQATRNIERLKAVHGAIAEMMAEAGMSCDGTLMAESHRRRHVDPDALGLAEAIMRKSSTVDAQRARLGQAFREKLREDAQALSPFATIDRGPWCYVEDMFPDSLVCSVESSGDQPGGMFQVPYSLDTTQDPPGITFGAMVEVEQAWVPKARPAVVTESGALDVEFVPLLERAIAPDGTCSLKLIDPGWGSSGYYSAEVLRRDGPKVFPAGLKMYLDHPTPTEEAERPERSVRDLAAVLTTGAAWRDQGPAGPGLYASAKVYEEHREALSSVADDIGVSIRANGRAKLGTVEGRSGPVIQEIVAARSVDFVTDPGRGGRILALAESKRAGAGGGTPTKEGDPMALTEAQQNELLANVAALTESNKALAAQVATLTTTAARQGEVLTLAKARSFVEARLPATLPAITRNRLAESLAGNPVLKDGVIDEAAFAEAIAATVKAEQAYLAEATGGTFRLGMGESATATTAATNPEELTNSLTESFKALGLSEIAATAAAKGR